MVNIGKWAFTLGVLLAIVTGFFAVREIAFILLVLGLVVGFLNITADEAVSYLVAVISLLVIGVGMLEALQALQITLPASAQTIFANFITFIAASGFVVAFKAVLAMGKQNPSTKSIS